MTRTKVPLILLSLTILCVTFTFFIQNNNGAAAADMSKFNPGRIIDDAVFYNKDTMTVEQIQAFLNNKVPICNTYTHPTKPEEAAPCLKDYRETTNTKSADAFCNGYGAINQSAAEIIYGVAQSCGINPQVLIVKLQKEQGLVTDTWPRDSWLARQNGGNPPYPQVNFQYRSAMGYGCPDTALCDSVYYGFFNQIYYAARQFKRYRADPTGFNYVAGRNNNIPWHPSTGVCGYSTVFIENQATAGLYNYTPYRPNAAALASSYGSGDACSSYGNRNFFSYFTDWFGSTVGMSVPDELQERYELLSGAIGKAIGVYHRESDGRVWQTFENGTIIYHPNTGAWEILNGTVHNRWAALGGSLGKLGKPKSGTNSESDGRVWQTFENGTIIYHPNTGAWEVMDGAIHTKWGSIGGSFGVIGKPTNEFQEKDIWSWQDFEKGGIIAKGDKAISMQSPELYSGWKVAINDSVDIGFPITMQHYEPDGRIWQTFEHGTIIYHPDTKAWVVAHGPLHDYWAKNGGSLGKIGRPIANQSESDDVISQKFQNGTIFYDGSTKQVYCAPS
ncbi:hypothetical protein FWF89_01745 [Candidatus Saccharibacteria bacterium]|nr:hypothetical protein [Candidatus Saccharibacteria bacterium]